MLAIVVDIDNTLFDSTERWNVCQQQFKKKSEIWNCFFDPEKLSLDKPIFDVINIVRQHRNNGYKVIIVTGRLEKLKEATIEQLKKFNIPFEMIFFRKEKDFRKDYEFKSEIVAELIKMGYKIELVIDDSEEVRKAVQQLGIKAIDPAEILK